MLLQIGPARFRAPELLFRPDLIGDESEGIHEVLAFAIQKSDMDLRRTLFSNIVLSGGSTLLKGKEMTAQACQCMSRCSFLLFYFQACAGGVLMLIIAIHVWTGFGDRLLSEVKKLAPKDVKIKVKKRNEVTFTQDCVVIYCMLYAVMCLSLFHNIK